MSEIRWQDWYRKYFSYAHMPFTPLFLWLGCHCYLCTAELRGVFSLWTAACVKSVCTTATVVKKRVVLSKENHWYLKNVPVIHKGSFARNVLQNTAWISICVSQDPLWILQQSSSWFWGAGWCFRVEPRISPIFLFFSFLFFKFINGIIGEVYQIT